MFWMSISPPLGRGLGAEEPIQSDHGEAKCGSPTERKKSILTADGVKANQCRFTHPCRTRTGQFPVLHFAGHARVFSGL